MEHNEQLQYRRSRDYSSNFENLSSSTRIGGSKLFLNYLIIYFQLVQYLIMINKDI